MLKLLVLAFFSTCVLVTIEANGNQCSDCSEEITSLRLMFDESKNIYIYCKELKTYSTEIYPVFEIDSIKSLNNADGLNLPHMINKCYNSRRKNVKYHYEHLSRDLINITKETFEESTHLKILELIVGNENVFLDLQINFLEKLTNLKHLTLEKNKINNLDIDFYNTADLTSLKIVLNHITEIQPNSFIHLTNLKILELYENRINTINLEAFSGLRNLETLSLSRNILSILSEFTFIDLPELRSLDLSRNFLETILKDTFQHNKKLEFLDISHNPNLQINDPVFTYLSSLKYLNLSYCRFTEITEDTFKGAKNLEYINLSYNQIADIDLDSFIHLNKLLYLNMSGNQIQTFEWKIYENIRTLNLLDVAYNKIEIVEKIPDNKNLEKLNLRGNKIKGIPTLSVGNSSLKSLDIGFNDLKGVVKLVRNYPQNGIFDLNLIRNRFTEIEWIEPDYDVSSREGTTSINFQENPLSCDPKMHKIEKCIRFPYCPQSTYMQVDINREKIDCLWYEYPVSGPVMVSLPIINVYDIPKECSLYYKENQKENMEPSFVLDCSLRNLTKIPDLGNFKFADTMFSKEIHVLLNGNKLTSFLNKDMDRGYNRVTHLNLSNNFIEKIDVIPKSVEVIDLSQNLLQNLNDQVLEDFTNNLNLQKIILSDNTWTCNCASQNLKEYLINNNNLKVNISDVFCKSTGTELVLLEICQQKELKMVFRVMLALMFVVLFIIMIFCYRFRTHIKTWLFSKNLSMWWVAQKDFDTNKTFDVFINYTDKDREFVEKALLPDLEKSEKPFKVCVR